MKVPRKRLAVLLLSAAVLTTGAVGIAVAASSPTPTNQRSVGRGINEYGLTKAYYKGNTLQFRYTKGFYCDTTVKAASATHCEGGRIFKQAPSKQFDPLYITVPLGFSRPMSKMDCPASLICVDHPGTVDLTRLEPALKPLYPTLTDAQLTDALKNFDVPGHDHFISDDNQGKAEWWDVKIVGVTSPTVYQDILNHRSAGYIKNLIKAKNKSVVGPIPTNIFLFFSAR